MTQRRQSFLRLRIDTHRFLGFDTSEVLAGSSYASQNELVVHVGLGGRTKVQSVTIDWPGSGQEVVGPLEAGELALVVEGLGVVGTFPFR